MIRTLSMLGILVFAIGGFVLIATWDGRGRFHRISAIAAYALIAAGIVLFVVGVFI